MRPGLPSPQRRAFDSQLLRIMIILVGIVVTLVFVLAAIVVLLGRAYLRSFEERLRRDLRGGK